MDEPRRGVTLSASELHTHPFAPRALGGLCATCGDTSMRHNPALGRRTPRQGEGLSRQYMSGTSPLIVQPGPGPFGSIGGSVWPGGMG